MCHLVCPSDLFGDSIFPLFAHHLLSYHPVRPSARQLHIPGCGQIPCAIPPMKTLALLQSTTLSSYEPNDYHITEATEPSSRKSSVEQRSPNDFDYDDVTIGKALSDACRRRADPYEDEGLSSCLSSSVSHDRTWRPVVCSLVSTETQL